MLIGCLLDYVLCGQGEDNAIGETIFLGGAGGGAQEVGMHGQTKGKRVWGGLDENKAEGLLHQIIAYSKAMVRFFLGGGG